jgi:hypothetical protein
LPVDQGDSSSYAVLGPDDGAQGSSPLADTLIGDGPGDGVRQFLSRKLSA